jgi:2-methylcitrate dehydratase PrpD
VTPGARLLGFAAGLGWDDLPKPVIEVARLAVLDWWAVTIGGVDEPVARLARALEAETGPGPASVLGTGRSAAPQTAAAWNGTASHALDYDDTHLDLPGHVCAPILPGLWALGEARGRSGREVLTAFVAGVEVMCRVAQALRPGHYRAGWHATATLGRLGGAAAAARLLGLGAAQVDTAVGLAAALGGGIQESFGTMAKPFQVGRAAGDAVVAVLAAEAGMTGAAGILDGARWARRLSPDWDPARLAAGLGERFALPAVLFKRYPCCFATHAALRALLDLAPGLAPTEIDRVELAVSPTALLVADQRAPRTGLGGKFSITYCAAAALGRGRIDEAAFTDAAVAELAVRALAERVVVRAEGALDETRARVEVRLRGGEVRTATADLRADDLEATGRALRAKFRDLVAPRRGAVAAARLDEALARIDEVEDLRSLA